MQNLHAPNVVGIGSWGAEIWPHKYLISPIEISVNWHGSYLFGTRPIYTETLKKIMKMLKCKKRKNMLMTSSVWYSMLRFGTIIVKTLLAVVLVDLGKIFKKRDTLDLE